MANQMQIKVENEHVLTEAILNGMNVSDILANNVKTYTASKDCIATARVRENCSMKLNNVSLGVDSWANASTDYTIPMKAGDVLTVTGSISTIMAYGIKR